MSSILIQLQYVPTCTFLQHNTLPLRWHCGDDNLCTSMVKIIESLFWVTVVAASNIPAFRNLLIAISGCSLMDFQAETNRLALLGLMVVAIKPTFAFSTQLFFGFRPHTGSPFTCMCTSNCMPAYTTCITLSFVIHSTLTYKTLGEY